MSAATRRPYLGEDVHFVTRFRGYTKCRTARVTDIIGDDVELYVLTRPSPIWREAPKHDESDEYPIGTWHFSCMKPLGTRH